MHLVLALLFLPFCYGDVSEGQDFKFEVLTQQNDVVWGFDFLPDERIIFTERMGVLKIFDPKTRAVTKIEGAPKVWVKGQGGLLDVRAHNGKIYLSYSERVDKGAATALMSGLLSGNQLIQTKKLLLVKETHDTNIHFGSRIEFDADGSIFLSVGERNQRSQAQNMNSQLGKIIHMKADGSGQEVWSLGHRNPQGLARNPKTGDLWAAEFGPKGGDELNLIKKGANYGWALVTHGREYSGEKIGEESRAGFEDPVAYWAPSISPSAITFYSGKVFPKWEGNLFIANLSGKHLRRIVLAGHKVVKQESLLERLNLRFRNVRTGPDGYLYLSTDDGKIARLIQK